MTRPRRPDDIPVRYGSRYGPADPIDARSHRACPVCTATLPSPRARYCSDACKQRAYRQRQADGTLLNLDALTADLRSRQALTTHTVYECPACEARFLGEQCCPEIRDGAMWSNEQPGLGIDVAEALAGTYRFPEHPINGAWPEIRRPDGTVIRP